MLNTNNISEKDREEISEIAAMLEAVPRERRAEVKGYLIGAESAEQALKEIKVKEQRSA